MSQHSTLQRGLNTRHIRFLALGSAIGTGLFYGSATAIKMATAAYAIEKELFYWLVITLVKFYLIF